MVPTSQIQMLGVPLGSDGFVEEFVGKKLLSRLDATMEKLVEFEDTQAAMYLLRISYGIVRAVHFMRTTPLAQWETHAVQFDVKVRDTAEQILGRPMSDDVFRQASISTRLGGLGLRRTVDHADLAFAASWHESQRTAREVWVRPSGVPEVALSQRSASFKFDEGVHASLLASAPNDREFQRLSRCAQPHANGFLSAVPSCEDGYDSVPPRNYRTAVFYRLGLPVVEEGVSCPMCMQPMDVFGDHAVCCTREGDIVRRHNSLRNFVYTVASDGLLSPVMEKRGILGPTSGRRPGDVTIPLWTVGKGLAIDVAVTSSLSKHNVRVSDPCEEYAALQKHAKYDASFEGKPYLFSAVVFETLGAINEEGCRVMSQLFRFAAKRLGREFSSYCGRGWTRLSCNLQRSVSQSILNRIDGVAPLEASASSVLALPAAADVSDVLELPAADVPLVAVPLAPVAAAVPLAPVAAAAPLGPVAAAVPLGPVAAAAPLAPAAVPLAPAAVPFAPAAVPLASAAAPLAVVPLAPVAGVPLAPVASAAPWVPASAPLAPSSPLASSAPLAPSSAPLGSGVSLPPPSAPSPSSSAPAVAPASSSTPSSFQAALRFLATNFPAPSLASPPSPASSPLLHARIYPHRLPYVDVGDVIVPCQWSRGVRQPGCDGCELGDLANCPLHMPSCGGEIFSSCDSCHRVLCGAHVYACCCPWSPSSSSAGPFPPSRSPPLPPSSSSPPPPLPCSSSSSSAGPFPPSPSRPLPPLPFRGRVPASRPAPRRSHAPAPRRPAQLRVRPACPPPPSGLPRSPLPPPSLPPLPQRRSLPLSLPSALAPSRAPAGLLPFGPASPPPRAPSPPQRSFVPRALVGGFSPRPFVCSSSVGTPARASFSVDVLGDRSDDSSAFNDASSARGGV